MTTNQNRTESRTVTRETKAPTLIAWHVTERGEKSFWTRIGAAWDHRSGKGYTLQLDLMPVGTGRIVLREPDAGAGAEQ